LLYVYARDARVAAASKRARFENVVKKLWRNARPSTRKIVRNIAFA